MKNKIRSCAVLLILCVFGLSQAAAETVSYEPTVRLTEEGGTRETVFVLEARDRACPMPAGSTALRKELRIKNAGSAGFGTIDFTLPGVYEYTVRQIANGGSGTPFDKTVYHMKVTAYLAEPEVMALSVVLTDDSGRKTDAPAFRNVYASADSASAPRTGVEDHWMLYFAGCVAIIGVTVFVIRKLWKDDGDE